jgi:hypothetical protein
MTECVGTRNGLADAEQQNAKTQGDSFQFAQECASAKRYARACCSVSIFASLRHCGFALCFFIPLM